MRVQILCGLLVCTTAQVYAAHPLSEQEMRILTETDTKPLLVVHTLQCPVDMSQAECDKLKALQSLKEGQNQAAYQQVLNSETQSATGSPNGRQPNIVDHQPTLIDRGVMDSNEFMQQLQQAIQQAGTVGK